MAKAEKAKTAIGVQDYDNRLSKATSKVRKTTALVVAIGALLVALDSSLGNARTLASHNGGLLAGIAGYIFILPFMSVVVLAFLYLDFSHRNAKYKKSNDMAKLEIWNLNVYIMLSIIISSVYYTALVVIQWFASFVELPDGQIHGFSLIVTIFMMYFCFVVVRKWFLNIWPQVENM